MPARLGLPTSPPSPRVGHNWHCLDSSSSSSDGRLQSQTAQGCTRSCRYGTDILRVERVYFGQKCLLTDTHSVGLCRKPVSVCKLAFATKHDALEGDDRESLPRRAHDMFAGGTVNDGSLRCSTIRSVAMAFHTVFYAAKGSYSFVVGLLTRQSNRLGLGESHDIARKCMKKRFRSCS
ncbi:unnamed protein product [Protopolystoma xenopodis]|uniref:Uncharacterized protein n=1 Tax=Protopolystoma xenopodis TaxID=117903 RepID=A0A3S5CSH1_9PLAT|nr:unnamed protein product [Protopolystoma xenopodis]